MKIRKLVRNFFGFSRAETNGFLVLMPLMIFVIFSEPLFRNFNVKNPINLKDETHVLDSLVLAMSATEAEGKSEQVHTAFHFNPNTVTSAELISLGFNTSLALRIENYRNKGGHFRVKKDLLKLYGMDSNLYTRLYPYVLLPENIVAQKKSETENKGWAKIENVKIDLNDTDTSRLKKVYGIGDKLALRIINYRNALGGFINFSQLHEVYGLDSVVIERITKDFFIVESMKPVTININTASEEILARHPYIKYKIAKAIVTYRYSHNSFSSLEELLSIKVIEQHAFEKMKPYLSVSD